MVALLAAAPIRISNFARLELGKQLRQADGVLHLRLDAAETKTRRADAWPVPTKLVPYLEHFVAEIRPTMLERSRRPANHNRLWIGAYCQPLEHQGVRVRILDVTGRRRGKVICPHSFRHAAATAFFVDHPDRPREAAALLGHAGFRTTERHYVRSRQALALLTMQDAVERFRHVEARGQGDVGDSSEAADTPY